MLSAFVFVASSAKAFAPFSQYSPILEGFSGSGQAQLGQSKPSFWFISNKPFIARTTPISLKPWRKASFTPNIPAACVTGFLSLSPVKFVLPVYETFRVVSFSIGLKFFSFWIWVIVRLVF